MFLGLSFRSAKLNHQSGYGAVASVKCVACLFSLTLESTGLTAVIARILEIHVLLFRYCSRWRHLLRIWLLISTSGKIGAETKSGRHLHICQENVRK